MTQDVNNSNQHPNYSLKKYGKLQGSIQIKETTGGIKISGLDAKQKAIFKALGVDNEANNIDGEIVLDKEELGILEVLLGNLDKISNPDGSIRLYDLRKAKKSGVNPEADKTDNKRLLDWDRRKLLKALSKIGINIDNENTVNTAGEKIGINVRENLQRFAGLRNLEGQDFILENFEENKDANTITAKYSYKDGDNVIKYNVEIDRTNNKVVMEQLNADGNVTKRETITKDKNKTTSMVEKYENGQLSEVSTLVVEDNKQTNTVKKYSNGELAKTTTTEYIEGKKVKETVEEYIGGKVSKKTTTEFDDNEKKTKEIVEESNKKTTTEFDPNGTVTKTTTEELDEQGNVTSTTSDEVLPGGNFHKVTVTKDGQSTVHYEDSQGNTIEDPTKPKEASETPAKKNNSKGAGTAKKTQKSDAEKKAEAKTRKDYNEIVNNMNDADAIYSAFRSYNKQSDKSRKGFYDKALSQINKENVAHVIWNFDQKSDKLIKRGYKNKDGEFVDLAQQIDDFDNWGAGMGKEDVFHVLLAPLQERARDLNLSPSDLKKAYQGRFDKYMTLNAKSSLKDMKAAITILSLAIVNKDVAKYKGLKKNLEKSGAKFVKSTNDVDTRMENMKNSSSSIAKEISITIDRENGSTSMSAIQKMMNEKRITANNVCEIINTYNNDEGMLNGDTSIWHAMVSEFGASSDYQAKVITNLFNKICIAATNAKIPSAEVEKIKKLFEDELSKQLTWGKKADAQKLENMANNLMGAIAAAKRGVKVDTTDLVKNIAIAQSFTNENTQVYAGNMSAESKSHNKTLAEQAFRCIDKHTGDTGVSMMLDMMKGPNAVVTKDNIVEFITMYNTGIDKDDDIDIIDSILSEHFSDGSKVDNVNHTWVGTGKGYDVIHRLINLCVERAKAEGVNVRFTNDIIKEWKNNLYNNKVTETNKKKEREIHMECINKIIALIGANTDIGVRTTYDAARENDNWIGKAGDGFLGAFGYNTIEGMTAVLDKAGVDATALSNAAKAMETAKTDSDKAAAFAKFKEEYAKIFGVPYNEKAMAYRAELQEKVSTVQMNRTLSPILSNALACTSLDEVTKVLGKCNMPMGYVCDASGKPTKQRRYLLESIQDLVTVYKSQNPNKSELECYKAVLAKYKSDLQQQANDAQGDYKDFAAMEHDLNNLNQTCYGNTNLGKQCAIFNSNQAATQAYSELAGELIAVTIATAVTFGAASELYGAVAVKYGATAARLVSLIVNATGAGLVTTSMNVTYGHQLDVSLKKGGEMALFSLLCAGAGKVASFIKPTTKAVEVLGILQKATNMSRTAIAKTFHSAAPMIIANCGVLRAYESERQKEDPNFSLLDISGEEFLSVITSDDAIMQDIMCVVLPMLQRPLMNKLQKNHTPQPTQESEKVSVRKNAEAPSVKVENSNAAGTEVVDGLQSSADNVKIQVIKPGEQYGSGNAERNMFLDADGKPIEKGSFSNFKNANGEDVVYQCSDIKTRKSVSKPNEVIVDEFTFERKLSNGGVEKITVKNYAGETKVTNVETTVNGKTTRAHFIDGVKPVTTTQQPAQTSSQPQKIVLKKGEKLVGKKNGNYFETSDGQKFEILQNDKNGGYNLRFEHEGKKGYIKIQPDGTIYEIATGIKKNGTKVNYSQIELDAPQSSASKTTVPASASKRVVDYVDVDGVRTWQDGTGAKTQSVYKPWTQKGEFLKDTGKLNGKTYEVTLGKDGQGQTLKYNVNAVEGGKVELSRKIPNSNQTEIITVNSKTGEVLNIEHSTFEMDYSTYSNDQILVEYQQRRSNFMKNGGSIEEIQGLRKIMQNRGFEFDASNNVKKMPSAKAGKTVKEPKVPGQKAYEKAYKKQNLTNSELKTEYDAVKTEVASEGHTKRLDALRNIMDKRGFKFDESGNITKHPSNMQSTNNQQSFVAGKLKNGAQKVKDFVYKKETIANSDGSVNSEQKLIFNRLFSEVTYGKDGKMTAKTRFNKKGQVKYVESYAADGKTLSTKEIFKNGTRVKIQNYGPDGKTLTSVTHFTDGTKIKYIECFTEGKKSSIIADSKEYKFNGKGRLESVIENGKTRPATKEDVAVLKELTGKKFRLAKFTAKEEAPVSAEPEKETPAPTEPKEEAPVFAEPEKEAPVPTETKEETPTPVEPKEEVETTTETVDKATSTTNTTGSQSATQVESDFLDVLNDFHVRAKGSNATLGGQKVQVQLNKLYSKAQGNREDLVALRDKIAEILNSETEEQLLTKTVRDLLKLYKNNIENDIAKMPAPAEITEPSVTSADPVPSPVESTANVPKINAAYIDDVIKYIDNFSNQNLKIEYDLIIKQHLAEPSNTDLMRGIEKLKVAMEAKGFSFTKALPNDANIFGEVIMP